MSRCRPNYFRVGFGFNLQLFYFQRGYHIIFFGGLPPLCVSCQRSMGGTALFWHHHQWHGHRLGVVLSWAAGGFSFLTNRLWGPLSIKAFLKMDPDLSQERSPHPSKSSLDQIGTQQCLTMGHNIPEKRASPLCIRFQKAVFPPGLFWIVVVSEEFLHFGKVITCCERNDKAEKFSWNSFFDAVD